MPCELLDPAAPEAKPLGGLVALFTCGVERLQPSLSKPSGVRLSLSQGRQSKLIKQLRDGEQPSQPTVFSNRTRFLTKPDKCVLFGLLILIRPD